MLLAHGTVVAVADGEHLKLFRNGGTDAHPKLTALPAAAIGDQSSDAGKRHRSSAANPDNDRQAEDGFAAGIAETLNKQALEGGFEQLVVIAAPKTLCELRRHWHKALEAKLTGEIAKDLTGHSIADIEAALAKA